METGEFNDRYSWELNVRKAPVARNDGLSADTFPSELYRVELIVRWGARGQQSEQRFVTMRSMLKEGQF